MFHNALTRFETLIVPSEKNEIYQEPHLPTIDTIVMPTEHETSVNPSSFPHPIESVNEDIREGKTRIEAGEDPVEVFEELDITRVGLMQDDNFIRKIGKEIADAKKAKDARDFWGKFSPELFFIAGLVGMFILL